MLKRNLLATLVGATLGLCACPDALAQADASDSQRVGDLQFGNSLDPTGWDPFAVADPQGMSWLHPDQLRTPSGVCERRLNCTRTSRWQVAQTSLIDGFAISPSADSRTIGLWQSVHDRPRPSCSDPVQCWRAPPAWQPRQVPTWTSTGVPPPCV